MNISLTKSEDAVSGVLKLEVVKADYADKVEKSLRTLRQKANIPGFRKGMVPMGMIKKLYGKSAQAEEVNKFVSEKLYDYIRDNKVNILGEPVPDEEKLKEINFETQEDFDFYFNLAFAPEIHIELNKREKLPYYQIMVDDEDVRKQMESYQANFGQYDDAADDVEEKDLIKGIVAELENGAPKEGGILVQDAVLMPMYIKDEGEKAKFIGAKKNSVIVFNPNKAYEGAEAEIASFLKIDKAAVAGTTNDFSFEIKEVTRHKPAELNQELFDKVFGEGTVKSEEEFKDKIKESINEQYTPESDAKFMQDARKMFLKKTADVVFADDILKHWLLNSSEKNTKEMVDEDYPKVVEDLKYHLVKEYLVKANDIKIEDEDVQALARKVAKAQFAQYGMLSVPDEVLANYAKDMLKNKQTVQNIIDRAVEGKIAALLKEKVKIEVKDISAEDFIKLVKEEKE